MNDPTAPRRRGVLIPWIIILAAVALIAGVRQMHYRALAQVRSTGATLSTDVMGVELAGRITIGVKALTDKLRAEESPLQGNLNLSPELEGEFPIRTAILLAEVAGKPQALKKLDEPLPPAKAADARLLKTLYKEGPDALGAEQKRQFTDKYGWFAQLALTHGRPQSDPQRQQVLKPALRAAIALIVLVVIGGPVLVTGLVLGVLALIALLAGSLRHWYQRTDPHTVAFLEAFAIYLGGMGLLMPALEYFWPAHPPALRWGIYFALPLAAFWPLGRGVSWGQWRQGLGWHCGRGFFREIGSGIVGYMTATPLMLVGLMISALLISATGQPSTHPIVHQAGDTGLRLLGLYLLACLWAPLAEETLFRGALYTHLRQGWGWIVSGLVVAFLFAIVHPQGWVALPVLGAFAFASASIREWRGSLLGCITAHAINNAVAVTMLIFLLR